MARILTRKDVELIIVCSDVHVPYHDGFAWNAFLKRLKDAKPDRLIINGDFADFLSVSLHDDGTPTQEFAVEVEAVKAELAKLRKIMGKKPIHYLEGNHENRHERYVAKKAPVLRGREKWHTALGLVDFGITTTKYGMVYKIGHLGFTHGVYAGDGYAKQHLMRYGTSLVIGHCHRAQIHTIPVAGPDGSQHVRGGFGIPCLCPVDEASYIKGPTGWTQGHGEFWIERDSGRFTADVVIYTEQRFWRDGKCYDGRA